MLLVVSITLFNSSSIYIRKYGTEVIQTLTNPTQCPITCDKRKQPTQRSNDVSEYDVSNVDLMVIQTREWVKYRGKENPMCCYGRMTFTQTSGTNRLE